MSSLSDASSPKNLQMIRVLIVEDEYILAINLKENLETLGYTVVEIADTAETAIEQATALHPHIILMDIQLRGQLDGIQAAEHIWQQLQIPVIFVTGHSDHSTVERATLTSPFGYVLKPIRDKELYVAIQTALNRYEREQFLTTVLREMGDGVIVVDPQLRIKYLNQIAEHLTGCQQSEVQDQVITEVIQFIDTQTQCAIEHPLKVVLQQQTCLYQHGNSLLVAQNAQPLPVTNSFTLLKNNQGEITGAVMVFRDDTQRRLLEEHKLATQQAQQAEIQVAELQRLARLKDDFLATTSHELRTPLSSIKMAVCMLETVLNQQGVLATENLAQTHSVNRYLTILQEQCDLELEIVNDLLDMRSLEADAYPLNLTQIELQNWLPHVAERFHLQMAKQQQTLQITIPPALPPFVSDMSSLKRIVSELINNACKYTPVGETIAVSVQAVEQQRPQAPGYEAAACDRFLELIVRNSGVTIAAEQLPQIFEPFYRIPSSDPWKHGGTGLGLALVKRLVEYLQGSIAVASDQSWTTFIVQLPLRFSADRAAGFCESQAQGANPEIVALRCALASQDV